MCVHVRCACDNGTVPLTQQHVLAQTRRTQNGQTECALLFGESSSSTYSVQMHRHNRTRECCGVCLRDTSRYRMTWVLSASVRTKGCVAVGTRVLGTFVYLIVIAEVKSMRQRCACTNILIQSLISLTHSPTLTHSLTHSPIVVSLSLAEGCARRSGRVKSLPRQTSTSFRLRVVEAATDFARGGGEDESWCGHRCCLCVFTGSKRLYGERCECHFNHTKIHDHADTHSTPILPT